jgi:uncharacterized protein (DUF4213/DUF364 family)
MDYRLYDELVEGIPAELLVEDFAQGPAWTAVISSEFGGKAAGACMSLPEATRPATLAGLRRGMSLRDLAAASKSWNFREASLGVAAINAYYNAKGRLESLTGASFGPEPAADPFLRYREAFSGKRVAAIGHFVDLETRVGPFCELAILERSPREGDYPDEAAEYLLPGRDFVFITGCTLANKSLPRLLELCRGAFVVLVGPSAPCAPLLFGHGVSALSSLAFPDAASCLAAVGKEGRHRFVPSGIKVNLEAPDGATHR